MDREPMEYAVQKREKHRPMADAVVGYGVMLGMMMDMWS